MVPANFNCGGSGSRSPKHENIKEVRDHAEQLGAIEYTHRSQTVICTLTVKSGPLQNFETSCTAHRILLHDFQIRSSGGRESLPAGPRA